jgi:Kef-type K+ transport system membrane component KefB
MIVVKLLQEHAEMDSSPGRLTVGILIFQDIWAIVVLAIQPDLANPQVLGLLKTFAMIAVLVIVALAYAKFVMPAVFMVSSKSVELMLVVALAWCFLMGCFATLPFIGNRLSWLLLSLVSRWPHFLTALSSLARSSTFETFSSRCFLSALACRFLSLRYQQSVWP